MERGSFNWGQAAKELLHWAAFLVLVGFACAGIIFAADLYSKESGVIVSVIGNTEVEKGDMVSLKFSSPMLKRSVSNGISIEPKVDVFSFWESSDKLSLRILGQLEPEKEYQVVVSGAKTRWLVRQQDIVFPLTPPDPPALLEFYPSNNQAEVDTMEMIKMKFDQPIGSDYTIEVKIDPQTGFDHVLDESGKQLSVVPKEKLSESTLYKTEVKLKSHQFPDFEKILYQGGFITKKPVAVTYTLDENGQAIKTEPKKEQITPQITEGKYIDIDLSSQTLYIFENAVEKGAYKISSGKRGMNTPEGTFKVLGKRKRPWSNKYKLYMPWFIQFTNMGHGIHELPEWPSGYKEGANHLGTPVSHGCVRLGVGPAKRVYDFADMGMPIVIHQ